MDSPEKDIHMMYWKEVRDNAADALECVSGGAYPETYTEVCDILADVLSDGSPFEAAKAVMAASEWVHAYNEIEYKTRQEEG